MVPGMILTGGKASAAPKDITLSGSMYNGKAVVTVVLHPDGTVDCDANGDKTEGTWEAGSGDVAMVAHLTVKGETVDMDITDTPEQGDTPEQSDSLEQSDAPTYPENSLVLDFTADINEQLQKTFYVESGTWGVAFGGQGDYTPADSADELFVWNAGKLTRPST